MAQGVNHKCGHLTNAAFPANLGNLVHIVSFAPHGPYTAYFRCDDLMMGRASCTKRHLLLSSVGSHSWPFMSSTADNIHTLVPFLSMDIFSPTQSGNSGISSTGCGPRTAMRSAMTIESPDAREDRVPRFSRVYKGSNMKSSLM
jgi:hypothetical protein